MSDVDPYGFFSDAPAEAEPRKRRVRSKRSPARDVESPVSPEPDDDDDDPYGFHTAAEEDAPGAASRGASSSAAV